MRNVTKQRHFISLALVHLLFLSTFPLMSCTLHRTDQIETSSSTRLKQTVAHAKAPVLHLEVKVSPDDFSTDTYYAVAAITATARKADGTHAPVTGKVIWSVVDSRVKLPHDTDPDNPVWRREPGALNGLAWGKKPPKEFRRRGNTDPREFEPDENRPTGRTAHLVDIVGSRTVTIQAQTSIDGVQVTGATQVVFGNGPLSVFTKGPSPHPLLWADEAPIMDARLFQAAEDYCGGSVAKDKFDGQENEYWTDTGFRYTSGKNKGKGYYYAEGSNLPSARQLRAVASYGNFDDDGIWNGEYGAAFAAGWPNKDYWTGEVLYNGLTADIVSLKLGYSIWAYGKNHTVCARPPKYR